MEKSLFAGLTILGPGESLSTDNGAFIGRDRETIDRLLEIGAKTHRHSGLDGLTNPTAPASAGVVPSGGTLAANLGISVGYTLEDANGGETMLSPVAAVSTRPPLSGPTAAPSGVADYTGGALQVNTYFYALTWGDGEGGETALGPAVTVERAPGFASGQIKLSQLNFGMAAAGAVQWRLYRATGGGTYNLLAVGGVGTSTFTDDGEQAIDCDVHPPVGEENTTLGISTLLVKLPSGVQSGTSFINLYASITGDFGGGSFLGQYPLSSAGQLVSFSTLELSTASPPATNQSIGGAHQIDPDSEILDWHWRKPVAASGLLGSGLLGDVKLASNSGQLYGVLAPLTSAAGPGQWTPLGSGTFVLTASAASGLPGSITNVKKLTFVGSGGLTVSQNETTPGEARITVADGPPRLQVTASGSAAPQVSVNTPELLELLGSAGVNLKETEPGAKRAKVVIEGQSVVLANEGMGVIVIPTSQKGMARPKAFKQYTWFCKEKPTNMAEFDIWIETGP